MITVPHYISVANTLLLVCPPDFCQCHVFFLWEEQLVKRFKATPAYTHCMFRGLASLVVLNYFSVLTFYMMCQDGSVLAALELEPNLQLCVQGRSELVMLAAIKFSWRCS